MQWPAKKAPYFFSNYLIYFLDVTLEVGKINNTIEIVESNIKRIMHVVFVINLLNFLFSISSCSFLSSFSSRTGQLAITDIPVPMCQSCESICDCGFQFVSKINPFVLYERI